MPEDGFSAASSEQTESRLTEALQSLGPEEVATLAACLDDPADPLGRRFAWLPTSIRHRLRGVLHRRRERVANSGTSPL